MKKKITIGAFFLVSLLLPLAFHYLKSEECVEAFAGNITSQLENELYESLAEFDFY